MKVGTRYRSQVCSTEVIVVRAAGDGLLGCGGHPMLGKDDPDPAERPAIEPGFDTGSPVGKRFVDADGTIEVLVTKAGDGGLSLDGALLAAKDAAALPSSD